MPGRILILEDDVSFSYSASKALESAGFDVVVAHDYLTALQAMEDGTIELLLADVVLGNGVNGLALARMARMRHQDLRVLLMTGYDLPADEAFGVPLHKPLKEEDLIKAVKVAFSDKA
jgi:DNA-binding response OmpR family regulator